MLLLSYIKEENGMERAYNKTGRYCYQSFGVCDHNMIDSPEKRNYCTGIGGECCNGSKYEYYIKKTDKTYYLRDAKQDQ